MLEPWVDVRADLDAINAGEGIYDPATRWIRVNGRLYGMHENGTKFPIEGDGIIPWNMPGDFPTWYGLTIDDDLVEYVDRALNTVAHGLGTVALSDADDDRDMTIHLPDGSGHVVRLERIAKWLTGWGWGDGLGRCPVRIPSTSVSGRCVPWRQACR